MRHQIVLAAQTFKPKTKGGGEEGGGAEILEKHVNKNPFDKYFLINARKGLGFFPP